VGVGASVADSLAFSSLNCSSRSLRAAYRSSLGAIAALPPLGGLVAWPFCKGAPVKQDYQLIILLGLHFFSKNQTQTEHSINKKSELNATETITENSTQLKAIKNLLHVKKSWKLAFKIFIS